MEWKIWTVLVRALSLILPQGGILPQANIACARPWVQAAGWSFIALKHTCIRSQNTLSNSCGAINKFKGHLQSDNTVFRLKEILIAADYFWVPWDSTQALNPLHKAITVALSTVAVMAVSHKINAFYYQKQSSPAFTCAAAPSSPDFASRERACWSKY